jgi:hypothetical protein
MGGSANAADLSVLAFNDLAFAGDESRVWSSAASA